MTTPTEDEGPGRVAYQGAPGAFSHEACLDLRPWDDAVGFETFQGAIEALLSGDCQSALIPVENSTIGVVEPAASLVREAGLTVVSEAWRPIRLALLGLPEARLSDIRTAESHPVFCINPARISVFPPGAAARSSTVSSGRGFRRTGAIIDERFWMYNRPS